jgi:succinate dehydrogenase hydrophobic anchor subunit
MGLVKWILEKIAVYVLVFAFFYIVGESLGIVPQPLKDFVSWLSQNFVIIAFTICVLAVCYAIIRLSSRGEENE